MSEESTLRKQRRDGQETIPTDQEKEEQERRPGQGAGADRGEIMLSMEMEAGEGDATTNSAHSLLFTFI